MVNLVFVVDTSASMNQRTSLGTTLLDVAKNAVETFIKIRQRDEASRTDRLMLVTLDEPPGSVKVGWGTTATQQVFYNELRNLQASGLSTLGSALKESFDLLNLYRLQSGIDNYGLGRKPFYVDPAIVLCITDGSSLVSKTDIERELHLPMHNNLPGSDLTKEPFRWDQRLFGLVLRMGGCRGGPKSVNTTLSTEPALGAMCDVTGGKCYKASSSKSLSQALESIAQKIQCGIVVNFEKIGGPDSAPHPVEVVRNSVLRETDSPTPPPVIDIQHHNGNGVEAEELQNKQINNTENGQPIKTEGITTSGLSTPSLPQRGNSMALSPTINGQQEEMGSLPNGISRSATASPIPQAAQPASWTSCCKMIYITRKMYIERDIVPTGFWPIPETFWPDPSMTVLAPRDAQPTIFFSCVDSEPQLVENLPFDKYELEPSPLTQYILEKKSPSTCWQTFIYNSGRKSDKVCDFGCPFGYLKASTNLQSVNLFVLPYNYPLLFPLLDELIKVHKLKPVLKWKQAFESYLATMPSYYAAPLRNAFRKMGIQTSLVPDHLDGSLSYSVVNYLKSVKQQSKLEAKRFEAGVSKPTASTPNKSIPSIQTPEIPSTDKKDFHMLLNHASVHQAKKTTRHINDNEINNHEAVQGMKDVNVTQPQSYKNPFDINRTELLDQLSRMRINFFHMAATSTILQEEDARHTVAIAEMGNYGKVLRQSNQLREIDPSQNRAHIFGNPYKQAKDQRVMVDEADVNEAAKRKRPDTPPVKWPTSIRHDTPSPTPHHYRPSNQDDIHKPIPLKDSKDNISNDIRTNNVLQSRQRKRKSSEDLTGLDGGSKHAKTAKHNIHPQLKKLQRLHQIKGQHSKKVSGTTNLPIGKHIPINNVDKEQEVSDISSILRNALTPRTEADKTNKVNNSHLDGLLNDISQNSTPSSSPSTISRRQLLREAHEENTQIRMTVFKELRSPNCVNELVIAQLGNLKGPVDVQCCFLDEIIEEAELFKKKLLVLRMKALLKKLKAGLSPPSNNHFKAK